MQENNLMIWMPWQAEGEDVILGGFPSDLHQRTGVTAWEEMVKGIAGEEEGSTGNQLHPVLPVSL